MTSSHEIAQNNDANRNGICLVQGETWNKTIL